MPNPKDAKLKQMGYKFYAEALGYLIKKVYQELHKLILVRENGIATTNDEDRCKFIKKALNGLQEVQNNCAEVLGYLHWSFCDNFVWEKDFKCSLA